MSFLFDIAPYVAPDLSPSTRLEIWKAYHTKCNVIANRIRKLKLERANRIWNEAFGCDIPDDNCVHNWLMNAEEGRFTGEYAWSRLQIRMARKAKELINDWSASEIASRATEKKWQQLHPFTEE